MPEAKPYCISKHLVLRARQLVKANRGAVGVDRESLSMFEKNLKGNLYKIWNRMSSGSYFPLPVRPSPIPMGDRTAMWSEPEDRPTLAQSRRISRTQAKPSMLVRGNASPVS